MFATLWMMGKGSSKHHGWPRAIHSRLLRACLLLLTCLSIVLQVHFSVRSTGRVLEAGTFLLRGVAEPTVESLTAIKEYIMWSKQEAYLAHCRQRFLNNYSWGKPLTPLVDKVASKQLVQEWDIPNVKIVQTLATLTKDNYTNFTVAYAKSLPPAYIIKPAHISGGVARVRNGTYHCFKLCRMGSPTLLEEAIPAIHDGMQRTLGEDYSRRRGEMQYKDVAKSYLIEEHLDMEKIVNDVIFWYMSNGKPIFASLGCGKPGTTERRRNYYSASFEQLPIHMKLKSCSGKVEKPPQWDKMLDIVNAMGLHLPNIPVRIDLYASDEEVYFSEFTYTTAACQFNLQPSIADGLMYAVYKDQVDPKIVTADFVTRTLTDKSWALVHRHGHTLKPEFASTHPSPVDLCVQFQQQALLPGQSLDKLEKWDGYHDCINALGKVASSDVRCIVSDNKMHVEAIGFHKKPTIQSIGERVDWDIVVLLMIALLVMNYYKIGFAKKKNQYLSYVIYCLVIGIYLHLTTNNDGFFSGKDPWTIGKDAFVAFQAVHPMTSPIIALSHFSNYWFKFAVWRSKSLWCMLFWQLMMELVTTSINEFTHNLEEQNEVRCMRLAFISNVKHYVFDEIIRSYIVPPFFVYGYLLPTFVCHWMDIFVSWCNS